MGSASEGVADQQCENFPQRRIVFQIKTSGKGELPSIVLENTSFSNNRAHFLVDTGASVNLLKIDTLSKEKIINRSKIFNLVGINSKMTKTIGETIIYIHGIETLFQIVANDFSIKYQGVLGINFLRIHDTILNFIDDYIKINNVDIPFKEEKKIKLSP